LGEKYTAKTSGRKSWSLVELWIWLKSIPTIEYVKSTILLITFIIKWVRTPLIIKQFINIWA
jgi:hypothetical protein